MRKQMPKLNNGMPGGRTFGGRRRKQGGGSSPPSEGKAPGSVRDDGEERAENEEVAESAVRLVTGAAKSGAQEISDAASKLQRNSEEKEGEGTSNGGYSSKLSQGRHARNADKLHEREGEGSNLRSRQMQKRNRQKEIMQRGREAKGSAGAASAAGGKAKAAGGKAGEALSNFVRDNPGAAFIGIFGGLVLMLLVSSLGSCGMFMSGGGGTVAYTSFTAKDKEIKAVEKEYQSLEKDLKKEMDKINKTHAGYNEYVKTIAPIEHDPFELAALLTVLYESYTKKGVKDYLKTILDGQYDLSTYATTETRYKTETRWHWVTKTREEERIGFRWEGMRLVMYTYTVTVEFQELESYEVQVPYDYMILHVTLTGRSIDDYVKSLGLSDEQLMRYEILLQMKGNKPEIFN